MRRVPLLGCTGTLRFQPEAVHLAPTETVDGLVLTHPHRGPLNGCCPPMMD